MHLKKFQHPDNPLDIIVDSFYAFPTSLTIPLHKSVTILNKSYGVCESFACPRPKWLAPHLF